MSLGPAAAGTDEAGNLAAMQAGDANAFAAVNVLRIEHGKIAEVTTFAPSLCRAFDLPDTLPGGTGPAASSAPHR